MTDRVALGLACLSVAKSAIISTVTQADVLMMLKACDGFDPDDPLASAARGFGVIFPQARHDAYALHVQGQLLKSAVEGDVKGQALRGRQFWWQEDD